MAEGGGGKGAGSDALFVIMVLVVLFIVWAASGGIERARQDPGYFLKPPAPLGSGEVYGSSLTQGVHQTGDAISQSLSQAQSELGTNIPVGTLSPYHGLVHLTTISGAGSFEPAQEYVEIDYNGEGSQSIPVTGWRIVSAVSNFSAVLPLGTRIPNSGALSYTEPIYLRPGEQAYIVTGRSPIGYSFLTNKCVPYFQQFQNFYPSLFNSCPYPTDELLRSQNQAVHTDNACYDFVSTLSSCRIYLTPLDPSLSGSCQNFVANTLTYTGCVENHRADADFYGHDWRIYLNRDQSLWRDRREVIKLLDQNGRTVDVLTY